jgi:hypothetical protein
MKCLLCFFMLLSPVLAAAESINLNAGFGVLACEIKNQKHNCSVPAQFAQSIEIILTKKPGSDFATGTREFTQEKNGHTFTGTLLVTKYTVQFASYYSLSISISSEAKKRQQLGSVFFPDPTQLNVVSWSGMELAEGNTYLIPVMAASSPTGNLAPLREEILRHKFEK